MIVGILQALFWQGAIIYILLTGGRFYIYEDYLPFAMLDVIVLIFLIFAVIFIAVDYMLMLADRDRR